MMYSLERFGRKPTAVTAFLLTAVFGLLWANAGSEGMVLAIGFGMIFFIQLAGNSSQIFISEVFPTNARASGFGLCQSAGRVGAFVAIPSFLWIQQGFGLTAVFVVIAVIVVIAAVAVSSRPEGSHLRALPDPYVNLSIHTAPDVRPFPWQSRQWAKSVGFARRSRSNQSRAPLVLRRNRLNLRRAQRMT